MLRFASQLMPQQQNQILGALKLAHRKIHAFADNLRAFKTYYPNTSRIFTKDTAGKALHQLIQCMEKPGMHNINDYHYTLMYDALIDNLPQHSIRERAVFIEQVFCDTDFLIEPQKVITMGLPGRLFIALTVENVAIALGARPTLEELDITKTGRQGLYAVDNVTRVFYFTTRFVDTDTYTDFIGMLHEYTGRKHHPQLASKKVKTAIAYVFHENGIPTGKSTVECLYIPFDESGCIAEGTAHNFALAAAASKLDELQKMGLPTTTDDMQHSKIGARALMDSIWVPNENEEALIAENIGSKFGTTEMLWEWKRHIDVQRRHFEYFMKATSPQQRATK